MKRISALWLLAPLALAGANQAWALDRPEITFKIFQFPPDRIPRMNGKADDWSIVPEDYVVGTDQLSDDGGKGLKPDPKSLDVRVKVGWVKGENRLYFLYEAFDDYWDFSQPDLHNDTFELVVDGDRSEGPLIGRFHPDKAVNEWDAWFSIQGVQAQNYHIFTPFEGKDWCMAWGPQAWWIKKMPWSNAACSYNFRPGESGKLTMTWWITPFDYASPDGPEKSIPSKLVENKIIGLSWAIMDYDDVKSSKHSFWNLSRTHNMYGDSSHLCAFKLMPLEPAFLKKIDAQWSFKVLDDKRRLVAFQDESIGKITSWKWDFGDGTTSTEQHPLHTYSKAGNYVVILDIEGPEGKSRLSKVWDVTLR
jgi:hypothetical protein